MLRSLLFLFYYVTFYILDTGYWEVVSGSFSVKNRISKRIDYEEGVKPGSFGKNA